MRVKCFPKEFGLIGLSGETRMFRCQLLRLEDTSSRSDCLGPKEFCFIKIQWSIAHIESFHCVYVLSQQHEGEVSKG